MSSPSTKLVILFLFCKKLFFSDRNFNSDYLSCDCGLRWVQSFFRSSSARLGDETLCAYPRSLRGKPLRALRESQLSCGKPGYSMEH